MAGGMAAIFPKLRQKCCTLDALGRCLCLILLFNYHYDLDYDNSKRKLLINTFLRKQKSLNSHSMEAMDTSVEKTLLVNPNCPIRIMLEYIRKKCRLGVFTTFDLCDESGLLMGLFGLQTYAYATEQFEHKKTYYLIVLKMESDMKRCSVLPQLNHENRIYLELKARVKKHLLSGDSSSPMVTTPGKSLPTPSTPVAPPKVIPATPVKTPTKKK